MDAFYKQDGDYFFATAHTIGPWNNKFQHAGPPSALLGRSLELMAGDLQMVRFGVDLLKPVPVATLDIQLQEITPGKRRRVMQAEMFDVASGTLVARAQALFLRQIELPLAGLPVHDGEPPLCVEKSQPYQFPFFNSDVGYHTAVELRVASGGCGTGQTQMWMRPKIALMAGEQPTPLQRLLVVSDSGNGVSAAVDTKDYSFANPDLTVNIRRLPESGWLCLDAHTHFQNNGLGMAESRIWDERGVIANATQNLLLEAQ